MHEFLDIIGKRLKGKRETITFLMNKDPEFRAVCEDYKDCVKALRYWDQSKRPEAEERVKEYRRLVSEIEDEIVENLGAANAQRLASNERKKE